MTLYSRPIIDACYLGPNREMFKVRFLVYCGEQIKDIVIENTQGVINTVDIDIWQNLKLVPCCYTGKDVSRLKIG